MEELITQYAMMIFYIGGITVTAGYILIKAISIVIKWVQGKDVTVDINELADKVSNLTTKGIDKIAKKNKVTINTEQIAQDIKYQVLKGNVQSTEQKEGDKV